MMTKAPEIGRSHRRQHVDVAVIGAGAAGLVAAEAAAALGQSVVVLNKGQVGRSGATATITGDISVDSRTIHHRLGLAGQKADSEELFLEDTLRGGAFLNHRGLAAAMIEEVGAEVKLLLDMGLKVAGIGHAPGHRYPRGVLVSGMQLLQLLTRKAAAAGVRFRDEFYVAEITRDDAGATGITGLDLRSGEVRSLSASAVIIAAGGGAMVHPFRTVPEELVGDGYHMALRAGAELVDMEMIQFLPCCLVNPPLWRGIQFPWIIGPQSGTRAWLLNRYGERFMARYDPERMEISTRDIISRACVQEVQEGRGGPGGGVFMSWAHLPHDILDFLPQWYGKPLLRSTWHWEGFDFSELVGRIKQGYAVEVMPAAHFMMGGVRIDMQGATCVPGLFACGEVAGGVHGANRLSGNACSQFLVQGRRAGRAAAAWAKGNDRPRGAADVAGGGLIGADAGAYGVAERVQAIANAGLSVLRSGEALSTALADIRQVAAEVGEGREIDRRGPYDRSVIDALEARSAILSVEAMALTALHREESRGAHYRSDFTEQDDRFLVNGVIAMTDGALSYRAEPVSA